MKANKPATGRAAAHLQYKKDGREKVSTIAIFARASLILGAGLSLISIHASAAGVQGLYENPNASPSSNNNKCMQTVQAELSTKQGSTALGPVVQDHGAGDARMDSMTGACKLADGDIDVEPFLNDGLGASRMWGAAVLEVPQDELASRRPDGKLVTFLNQPSRLPATASRRGGMSPLTSGGSATTELASLENSTVFTPSIAAPAYRARSAAGVGSATESADPGLFSNNSPAAAVPEPSTYAMLLAGLATLAAVARIKSRRSK